jgi:hypothetical protein
MVGKRVVGFQVREEEQWILQWGEGSANSSLVAIGTLGALVEMPCSA